MVILDRALFLKGDFEIKIVKYSIRILLIANNKKAVSEEMIITISELSIFDFSKNGNNKKSS